MNPIISFITITYNGYADTCELIEALQSIIKSISYEIIVVDNASLTNEAQLIRDRYPNVQTIRSNKNLGFSGGNNLGITIAKGDYLFIINNDTFIEEDSIHYLLERLRSNPKIGGVSPKIRFAFAPQNIQFAGFTKLTSITLRNNAIGYDCPDSIKYNKAIKTPYLHGAAMLIKREVINKIGLMPEIYFLYYEELDWCTKMTSNGYDLWYEPQCTIYHKESQSTGLNSPFRLFYITRNRLLYAWRNLSKTDRIISIIYQIALVCPKTSIMELLKGNGSQSKAIWRGVYAFLKLSKNNNSYD